MKEAANVLYPNETVGENVLKYANAKSTGLPEALVKHHDWILANRADANMTISQFQAKNLIWLARAIGAKRVLEIGVFMGFSCLVWAHAVGPEGTVTGLEFEPASAKIARETFETQGVKNVTVVVGDAHGTLAELTPSEPYDLVFIDADKTGYPHYLETLLAKSKPGDAHRLLRPGAIIIADNILRRGIVADSSDANPRAAVLKQDPKMLAQSMEVVAALDKFNTEMGANPRLEGFLVPLYDGLGLARLVD